MNESLREKRGSEAIFEDTMAENFPELMKDINPLVQTCNKSKIYKRKEIYSPTSHNEAAESLGYGENFKADK